MKRALCALALSLACAVPAAAHHGKDFLVVEAYELPQPGTIYFVSSEMVSRSTFTSEPSLLFGVARRFAGEVHVHISRKGYEAVAPAVHIQLTSSSAWNLAASAEYEIARHSAENTVAARLIGARSIGEGQLVINVGGDHSRADGTHAGYAIGYRPEMEARTSWGVEAQGRLERGEQHELILGIYTQPNDRFTVKAGAGLGFGNGRASAVSRTGIVWRF